MRTIDLHTHSNASDGTLSPEALVRAAFEAGLCAVALTDHDTTAGLKRAQDTARSLCRQYPDTPFEFIPGIELSISHMERELHIVGLHLQTDVPEFTAAIKQLRDNRDARNHTMIAKMQAAGIDITMDKLIEDQGGGVLTRANFASYLMHRGYIKTLQEGFLKYFDRGKPFYTPREYMDPATAIELIHSVHGLAILAHPLLYHFSDRELEQALSSLKALRLDGMETLYSMNTAYDDVRMRKLAAKYELLQSGGSDFHGVHKPHIRLGTGRGRLFIPEDILIKQKNRI